MPSKGNALGAPDPSTAAPSDGEDGGLVVVGAVEVVEDTVYRGSWHLSHPPSLFSSSTVLLSPSTRYLSFTLEKEMLDFAVNVTMRNDREQIVIEFMIVIKDKESKFIRFDKLKFKL